MFQDSESIEEIPERREEEEQLNLAEETEVFSLGDYFNLIKMSIRFWLDINQYAEIKTDIPQKEAYDPEPVSQRLAHEEKGICDSREAEKDIEVISLNNFFICKPWFDLGGKPEIW